MNPLLQNNPIIGIMNMLRNGNPKTIAENIMSQNPECRQMLQNAQNACGNGNPKDFVLDQAKQNGMDPEQVMKLANMMGLK